VEEDEALAIGAAEQVIGVMLGVGKVFGDFTHLCDLFVSDDELLPASGQIDVGDAAACRRHVVKKTVADARVSVTWAAVGDPRKITGNSFPAIGAERIYGAGDGAFLPGVDVENMTYKTIRFPIVPNHLEGVSRNPLEHAALLPAPGPRGAQRDPFVSFMQVNHSDLDQVVRRG
jgi:hypothetical protein